MKSVWFIAKAETRPATKTHPCDICGDGFRPKARIVIEERQINWFRGDDEVYFYHEACDPRRKDDCQA